MAFASRPIFRSAREVGAYYRSALAHQLQQRGYAIEQGTGNHGRYFEIAGVPRGLLDAFSARSREVARAAERFRAKWGRAPERGELRQLKLENRKAKVPVTRADLQVVWNETAVRFDFVDGAPARLLGADAGRGPEGVLEDRVEGASRVYHIAKDEALALDDLAELARNRLGKDRSGMDKGVELAVLTTRVNVRGQVGEKLLVVCSPREGGIERSRVQTNDDRLEAGGDELPRQGTSVASPERKETAHVVCGESLLAVGADILEKEVAEDDGLDVGQGWRVERLGHACLINVVDARRRDANLDERSTNRVGLLCEKLATDTVHADAIVGIGHGRDQGLGLHPLAAEGQERQSRVLATAPRERGADGHPRSTVAEEVRIAFVTLANASSPLSLRSSAPTNASPRVRRINEPLARSCSPGGAPAM